MEILETSLIGIGVSLGAIFLLRGSEAKHSATITVGVIGALLGLATHVGMGHEQLVHLANSERLAAGYGAALTLFLWIVAQRLFLQTPGTSRD